MLIQAPYPEPAYYYPPAQEATAYQPYQAPAPQQQPVHQQPAPQPQYQEPQPHYLPPQLQNDYAGQPQGETPPGTPNPVRPEPRQLPNRSEPVEAPTRVRSEPSGETRLRAGSPVPPVHRHRRNRFLRFLVPLLVLLLLAGAAYGVKTFLQIDRLAANQRTAPGKGAKVSKVKEILPEDNDNTFEALTEKSEPQALPVGEPEMPRISTGEPQEPADPPPVDGGIAALRVLEDFLAMKNLADRLPHLESKRSQSELEASVLNAPLPEVRGVEVDVRDGNSVEQLVDYYFHVDFVGENGGINTQTMLVRTQGESAPKMVVDPFLDLFGGRFAEYASTPRKAAGTFQVIISAGAFCYDDVPAPEKKFTLKILSRENSREIAKAYFGRRSKIGMMLQDEGSGLGYGQAKPCTVFIRWNLDEDPERPFLEALDITSLDWNP